jgi:hypothetical protein
VFDEASAVEAGDVTQPRCSPQALQ